MVEEEFWWVMVEPVDECGGGIIDGGLGGFVECRKVLEHGGFVKYGVYVKACVKEGSCREDCVDLVMHDVRRYAEDGGGETWYVFCVGGKYFILKFGGEHGSERRKGSRRLVEARFIDGEELKGLAESVLKGMASEDYIGAGLFIDASNYKNVFGDVLEKYGKDLL